MIKSPTIIIAMKGITSLNTSAGEHLAKEEVIKTSIPTGGVRGAMRRLAITIKPKWMGSIPIAGSMGPKMGIKIMSAGNVSIGIPTISKKMFINNRNTIGFLVIEIINAAASWGIRSAASIQLKGVEIRKIIIMIAVSMAAL